MDVKANSIDLPNDEIENSWLNNVHLGGSLLQCWHKLKENNVTSCKNGQFLVGCIKKGALTYTVTQQGLCKIAKGHSSGIFISDHFSSFYS